MALDWPRRLADLECPGRPVGPVRDPLAGGDRVVNVELIVAKTLWGSARRDGLEAMAGIANVIGNRKKRSDLRSHWWGVGWVEICTKPGSFNCWKPESDIRLELENVTEVNPRFRECLMLARELIHGDLPDRTKGADYTHPVGGNTIMPAHVTRAKSSMQIGRHLFYRLES
jgi:N-acetylmuramoyl-L-alanine amidase